MDSLPELFCDVDDYCQIFEPLWHRQQLASGEKKRQRACSLTINEIMTILITFHQSHYRDFKAYYCEQVVKNWHQEFPGLVSYTRFVGYIPYVVIPLIGYLSTRCLRRCSGISFIDSTALDVCLNQRIHSHKVFAGLAGRGKTSTGWFFGFKLHLVVNNQGKILRFCLTPGNLDDRKPVPHLATQLFGKLFGDLNNNVPVMAVSRRLGHAKPSITLNIYGHLLLSTQSEIAELIDGLITPIQLSITTFDPSKSNQSSKND